MTFNALSGLALIGWFAVLALAEAVLARGGPVENHGSGRLVANFGFGVIALAASLVLPLANLGAAEAGEWAHVGLVRYVPMPWAVATLLLLIVQSFAAYWVHRLMHWSPMLWRVHRVHHCDSAVDVSTAFRNHPLELVVVVPVETAVVLLLGADVSMVVAVQTLLAASLFWQHADIRLPARVEALLSKAIITPHVHRVHHHPARAIHDRNYGDLFIWWDRLFRTLEQGEGGAPVGLTGQRARPGSLAEQLWSPFYGLRAGSPADMGTLPG